MQEFAKLMQVVLCMLTRERESATYKRIYTESDGVFELFQEDSESQASSQPKFKPRYSVCQKVFNFNNI